MNLIKKVIVGGALLMSGFIGGTNLYNLTSFNNSIDFIKENPDIGYGSAGNAIIYSLNHIVENDDFPSNILTILSREEAEKTIEEANKFPFTF